MLHEDFKKNIIYIILQLKVKSINHMQQYIAKVFSDVTMAKVPPP